MKKIAYLPLGCLLSVCVFILGVSDSILLADNSAHLTFREASQGFNLFPKKISPHITIKTILLSNSGEKSYLEIHSKKGVIRVAAKEDGSIEFPSSQDLLDENPPVYLYPDGPGSFSFSAEFNKKETLEPEYIKYSELTIPFLLGAKLKRNHQIKNNLPLDIPSLKELVFSFQSDKPCELVIKGDKEDVVIKADNKGLVTILHSDELVLQDPYIVFPLPAARLVTFRVIEKERNGQVFKDDPSKRTEEGNIDTIQDKGPTRQKHRP